MTRLTTVLAKYKGLNNQNTLKKAWLSHPNSDQWSLHYDDEQDNFYLEDEDTGKRLVQGSPVKLVKWLQEN